MTNLIAIADLLPNAVIDVLKWNGDLMAIVGGRIYDTVQPSGAGFPFVILEAECEFTNDSPRPNVEVEIAVWCYATSGVKAQAMAEAVTAQLHMQPEGITVTGWNVYWCALRRVMRDSYVIDNQQYWSRKLIFELRVDKVVD